MNTGNGKGYYKTYGSAIEKIKTYEHRIKLAEEDRSEWIDEAQLFIERYDGTVFPTQISEEGHIIATSDGTATIDALFSSMTSVEIDINVVNLGVGTRDQAYLAQEAVRDVWREQKVARESEDMIKDALLVDIGFIKVGYEYEEKQETQERDPDEIESEMLMAQEDNFAATGELLPPEEVAARVETSETVTIVDRDRVVVDYVPFDELYWDPTARRWSDVRWVAQVCYLRPEEVKENEEYREFVKGTKGGGMKKLDDLPVMYRYSEDFRKGTPATGDDEWVKTITFYDLEAGTICTYADGTDFLLSEKVNMYGFMDDLADRNPFVALVFRKHPRRVRGVGDMRLMRSTLEELDLYRCVTPETPILTADLEWVAAGKLQQGDELVGFDEGNGRKSFRRSVVEVVAPGEKPCMKVTTPRGEVTASEDHPWLTTQNVGENTYRWVATKDLIPGRHILVDVPKWDYEDTREAGWLAGMFDGEGSLCVVPSASSGMDGGIDGDRRAVRLQIVQNEGKTLDRIEAELTARGFEFSKHVDEKGCAALLILGGRYEFMRLLGSIRPQRLLDLPKAPKVWEGFCIKGSHQALVTSVESVGVQPVISLQTSSRTYIAGGFLCHNTYLANYTDNFRPKWISPQGLLTTEGKKAFRSRGWLEVVEADTGRSGNELVPIAMPQLPQEVWDIPDKLSNSIREATGVNELMRGFFPDRKRTATETTEVVAASAGRQAEKRNQLARTYEDVSKRILWTIQLMYDAERMQRVTDFEGDIEWTWTNEDIASETALEVHLTPKEQFTAAEREDRAVKVGNLMGAMPGTDLDRLKQFMLEEMGYSRALISELVQTAEEQQVAKQGELQDQANQQDVAGGMPPNPAMVSGPLGGADLAQQANPGEIPAELAGGLSGGAPGSEEGIASLLEGLQ